MLDSQNKELYEIFENMRIYIERVSQILLIFRKDVRIIIYKMIKNWFKII